MGYIPNDLLSRRLFCCRLFLDQARAAVVSAKEKDNASVRTLCALYGARFNIVRGLRAAFILAPDDHSDLAELAKPLKNHFDSVFYQQLMDLLEVEFEVQYSGSGGGYYTFVDGDGNQTSATNTDSPHLEFLINTAIDERRKNLRELLDFAQSSLFEAVYLVDNADDLAEWTCYDHWDKEDFFDVIVSAGLAATEADAIAKYGDDPYKIDAPEVIAVFKECDVQEAKTLYDDRFWDWDETDSIYH